MSVSDYRKNIREKYREYLNSDFISSNNIDEMIRKLKM